MIADLRAPRRTLGLVLVSCLILVMATGCGPTSPSPGQATPGPASPTPMTGTASPTGPAPTPELPPPTAELPAQTNTDWGRIWDELPPAFPRYPGSVPAEFPGGPVTATVAIPAPAGQAAAYMRAALETAGYSTSAMSGPLEDGSIVVESVGTIPGCRVRTRLTPFGDTSMMAVWFGAGCPFR